MTDPTDPNSELDRAIARLVHDAGADAPQPPDIPAFERPAEPTSSDAPAVVVSRWRAPCC